MKEIIRLAIQKSGRLSEKSLQFIEASGISYFRNKTKLKSTAYNFPLEILFLRDDDIPKYVADGVADIGIVGENVVAEKRKKVEIAERMGFSKCRLSLAIPQAMEYEGLQSFQGMRIATSYPNLTQNFLKKNDIQAEIHEISGSVEIAPSIGLAQAVCDLVSSGSTLLSNGLKEVEVIFRSEAVLIKTPKLNQQKTDILKDLLFRIRSVLTARQYKYILLNLPNTSIERVCALMPGMKSPTIMPLAQEGWSSLHSVLREDDFWEVIDMLKAEGAQGILVSSIEKMIL